MPPTVYLRESDDGRRRFHRTADCRHLLKPVPGSRHQTLALPLDQVSNPHPCRSCYPDAPRVPVVRRVCKQCSPKLVQPCAHNGGVQVFVTMTRRKHTVYTSPGETFTRSIYVWPDQAHHYANN